jgi:PTH1 family peptidyl-tRNA hydrolase
VNQTAIALIAGLGNPGKQYIETRHNVGFWFIERLQRQYQIHFSLEKKFKAETGTLLLDGRQIRVIVSNTFMNLSGQSVAPMASFYRIATPNLLVIHDELDLPAGTVRIKVGGGHGGHNGLRDISSRIGSSDFVRLRIGIGHPGSAQDVSGYVLKRPNRDDKAKIEDSIDRAIGIFPDLITGDIQKAMNSLHGE